MEPPTPCIATSRASAERHAQEWSRWLEVHHRLAPNIGPNDVLCDGVWAGRTAKEAMQNADFAHWSNAS